MTTDEYSGDVVTEESDSAVTNTEEESCDSPVEDHHVIATTREGRRIPIWDSRHNRDTFTKEEAFATAERYGAKVKEYTYAAVSIVEHAWSDLVALTESTIAKLDEGGATELQARITFDGGDHGDGDHAAEFLSVDGAHEAFTKARAVPSAEHEAKVQTAVDAAIVRAAERDAERAAAEAERIRQAEVAAAEAAAEAARVEAEAEAARIAQSEADAANVPQAELGAVATENAGSGGEHGDSTGGEPAADGGEAHATTDGGDDKPPPTE